MELIYPQIIRFFDESNKITVLPGIRLAIKDLTLNDLKLTLQRQLFLLRHIIVCPEEFAYSIDDFYASRDVAIENILQQAMAYADDQKDILNFKTFLQITSMALNKQFYDSYLFPMNVEIALQFNTYQTKSTQKLRNNINVKLNALSYLIKTKDISLPDSGKREYAELILLLFNFLQNLKKPYFGYVLILTVDNFLISFAHHKAKLLSSAGGKSAKRAAETNQMTLFDVMLNMLCIDARSVLLETHDWFTLTYLCRQFDIPIDINNINETFYLLIKKFKYLFHHEITELLPFTVFREWKKILLSEKPSNLSLFNGSATLLASRPYNKKLQALHALTTKLEKYCDNQTMLANLLPSALYLNIGKKEVLCKMYAVQTYALFQKLNSGGEPVSMLMTERFLNDLMQFLLNAHIFNSKTMLEVINFQSSHEIIFQALHKIVTTKENDPKNLETLLNKIKIK